MDLKVKSDLMEKIVSLCKRRGFIYPGSEIYGGITGFWDYGPLGVELKNNIKHEWWKAIVSSREDVVGLNAAIIMNPKVWQASGHTEAFTDPLVECKVCHKRFISGKKEELKKHEKEHAGVKWTLPKKFNLLTEVYLGTTEPKQKAYLRGEITQGVFVNFQNVVDSTRVKIPFGIAQIGKAFRNEITPGNFTFRSREFEQMELEYFIEPSKKQAEKWFNFWKEERMKWYILLGIKRKNLHFRDHKEQERAHYAQHATDIEYCAPFGWSELEGIHDRGNYDLKNHKLSYNDENGRKYTPWVIETSGGVDRSFLFFLLDSYYEEKDRIILKLQPKLAPFKVAVFPLLANKENLLKKAKEIYLRFKTANVSDKLRLNAVFDDRGNIGKRYYSQDEIGTPWCITVDFKTLEDNSVTIRDRDTAKQERVNIDLLEKYFENKLKR